MSAETVTVWGIAAGRRTTKEAARGAFTARTYPVKDWDKNREDWLSILAISPTTEHPKEATA
jgi:hypothetical protein